MATYSGRTLSLLAGVAETSGRMDDMASYMEQFVQSGQPLTANDREFFTAAFKESIQGRRQALRAMQLYMASMPAEAARFGAGYFSRVAGELSSICKRVIALLDEYLIPREQAIDALVHYQKMKGDYYRYLAENNDGGAREDAIGGADLSYRYALDAAQGLPKSHYTRLGLVLNYAVFQYEVLKNRPEAIATIQRTQQEIQDTPHDQMDENALHSIQLLRENLAQWEQEQQHM